MAFLEIFFAAVNDVLIINTYSCTYMNIIYIKIFRLSCLPFSNNDVNKYFSFDIRM
jgi:hypothetical protein